MSNPVYTKRKDLPCSRVFPSELRAFTLALIIGSSSVMADALHFPFDEGSGTVTRDTVHGVEGFLGNGFDPLSEPVWTNDTPSGMAGDFALAFNLDQPPVRQEIHVDLVDQPLNLGANDTNYTLQAWVKLPTRLNTDRMVIYRTAGPGPRVSLSIHHNRTLHTTVYGNTDFASSVVIPNDNRWHHIAVVMENNFGRVRFYLDGISRQTVNRTANGVPSSSGSAGLLIGRESDTRFFTGMLDRVRLNNVALAAEELDYPAVAGLARFDSFEAHPADVTAEAGATVVFQAAPTVPVGDASYYWVHRTNLADAQGRILPDDGSLLPQLTVANLSAADRGFYSLVVSNAAGLAESYSAALEVLTAPGTLERMWELVPGDRPYLTPWTGSAQSRDLERGMGYNPVTDHLLIGARVNSPTIKGIYIVDADTGADLGELQGSSAITGGTIVLTRVAVADDGAIYACNFGTLSDSNPLKIYRWASETAPNPTLAYAGNPVSGIAGNQQWGKNMIVRGSGAQTQILMDTRTSYMALFTTSDGENFLPTIIQSDAYDDAGVGMVWGEGNTFWGSNLREPLYQWELQTDTGTTRMIRMLPEFPNPALINFGFSEDYRYLAGLVIQEGPDAVELYEFTTPGESPVLLDRALFTTDYEHTVNYGNVHIAGNRVFALEPNNGLIAFRIKAGSNEKPSLAVRREGNNLIITWAKTSGAFTLEGTDTLTNPTWSEVPHQLNGEVNTATVGLTGATRFFRLRQ